MVVELAALKPLLSSLALPPLGLMLLALFGMVLALFRKRIGLELALVALIVLGVVSSHGVAVWLARNALPQFDPVTLAKLQNSGAQAVFVLGGGLLPEAPEYGSAQPSERTAARLRYGITLSRQAKLPLGFTGGIGWAASERQKDSEAEVARRVAAQEYGAQLRWSESEARDTSGSARLLAPLLKRDRIERIALVTDAWHMPRAVAAFEKAGIQVIPAPMGFILPVQQDLLEWLPSAHGLLASQRVLHEWLGLAVGKWLSV